MNLTQLVLRNLLKFAEENPEMPPQDLIYSLVRNYPKPKSEEGCSRSWMHRKVTQEDVYQASSKMLKTDVAEDSPATPDWIRYRERQKLGE